MTATAGKTYYCPGLVFKAHEKAQGHQEICRGEKRILAVDGTVIDTIRELLAEFGVYGSQYRYIDPDTQREETGSEFRGGYFNLDEQAEDKGWDDDEKEIVARHMIRLAENGRAQFSLYSKPKIGAPWPTYDTMHHSKIVETAVTLGFVSEALLYEEQEKARPSVVQGLREALASAQAEPVNELVAD